MTRSFTRIFLTLGVCGLVLNSCVPDDDDGIILRSDYIGIWDVNETEGNFAPQFYSVNISAGTGEDEIVISGLYNTPGTQVQASINGPSISIPSQQTGGISFSGSGQANDGLTRIDLSFTANDGTGNDQVKAVLTP